MSATPTTPLSNGDELSEHQTIRGVLLDLAESLINGGGLQQGDTLGKMHFDAATERITAYYAALIKIERLEAELYGRLHETIELFQKGILSADQYSKRHAELTAALKAERSK